MNTAFENQVKIALLLSNTLEESLPKFKSANVQLQKDRNSDPELFNDLYSIFYLAGLFMENKKNLNFENIDNIENYTQKIELITLVESLIKDDKNDIFNEYFILSEEMEAYIEKKIDTKLGFYPAVH